MNDTNDATRRGFLGAAAGLLAAAGSAAPALAKTEDLVPAATAGIEPFWGMHQGGIATPAQRHTYFAAFDLTATSRDDVVKLLKAWTAAAARLTQGHEIEPFEQTDLAYSYDTSTTTTTTSSAAPTETKTEAPDSGEASGLPAARLTLTFGFGAGLFVKDGKDRYGLAQHRPEALVDIPHFPGDQLVPAESDGDLSIQACADDPQVAFHAVRQLARLAEGSVQLRWVQSGFAPDFGPGKTGRNLMGFRDGTNNPKTSDPKDMDAVVWVGTEGPDWMQGGSYLVARRIRIALEHWDKMNTAFQEQTVGRHKGSGAPLGMKNETDAFDFDAKDKDGNPLIPQNSHVRLAAAETNGGARILRRAFSYNNGAGFTAERWPPWRQGIEYDAGLFFLAYQRDPRTGFIKIFENVAKFDMMNQFVTHVAGGLYAIPAGAASGEYIGQKLFSRA